MTTLEVIAALMSLAGSTCMVCGCASRDPETSRDLRQFAALFFLLSISLGISLVRNDIKAMTKPVPAQESKP